MKLRDIIFSVIFLLISTNELLAAKLQADDLAKLKTLDDPIVIIKEKKILTVEEKINLLSPDAKEFVQKISSVKTMLAEFSQIEQNISDATRLDVKTNTDKAVIFGKLRLAKPNKLKWEITSPNTEKQLYVTNGSKFWHYDLGLEQVVLDDFNSKRLASSPFYFLLSNIENIGEQYDITKKGTDLYSLKPNKQALQDSNYISDLELKFRKDSNIIKYISFIAAKNKKVIIELDYVRVNKDITNSNFNFSVPSGVDVIKANELY